jgi:hypothetical protein
MRPGKGKGKGDAHMVFVVVNFCHDLIFIDRILLYKTKAQFEKASLTFRICD